MEHKSKNVICQNCKGNFTIEPDDFSFYEKIKVPPPTFCPKCRLVRRLGWRNERSLYKRACDLCNRKLVSMYDAGAVFPVYCPECWKSDKWDPLSYAKDYDFNKPFFEQFKELLCKVPRQSVWQFGNCIDTEYANFIQDAKNIYLSYSIIQNSEDVYYSSNVDASKNIFDSYNVTNSELVYESIGSEKNYNCQYSYWSSNCIDSNFILDCINCQNCFGCVNLRSKNYCIWNEQYEKNEYFKKLKDINMGSSKFVSKTFADFWRFALKFPRKYGRIINCSNSFGDELRNCKNTLISFNSHDTEDGKFLYRCLFTKNAMDVSHGHAELVYEHAFGGSDNSFNIKFVISGAPAMNESEYYDLCESSSNIFGCIGLKSKKYCIFNKQYTKEDYLEMLKKIKEQMDNLPYKDKKGNIYKYGEFFPMEFSPFGYNETIINEYLPLIKQEIVERGYNWKDKTENIYSTTLKSDDIPDDIKDIDDSILDQAIECPITKKAFKITLFELKFYRRMGIPIPKIHYNERYRQRFSLKNPMELWRRECMCDNGSHPSHLEEGCSNEFETSYAPNRPEKVYCERCYQQEVY